jgi:two-component system, OmpR family, response regulator
VPSTSGRNLHVVSASNAQASAKRLRLRVLIADDDRDTATMLAMVLRDEGDEVHTTLRGDEVLEACRLLRPDVVIVDINMPGMSGYAIARELRERHGTLAPLLIAISGVWTRTSDRLVGTAVGFDHYLLKPCEPKEVLRLTEPLRSGSSDANSAA